MTNTITESPATTEDAVRRIYAAVARGDVGAVLAELSDDIDWAAEATSASVPWYGHRRGKDEVAGFFGAMATAVDITRFDVLVVASTGNDVVSVVRWSYTVRATGRTADMHMFHWWHFDAGKVSSFRGGEDTEQSSAAFVTNP